MEGTMGHLRWYRYPLVPLVWRFTIMGDLPSLFKKKKNIKIFVLRNYKLVLKVFIGNCLSQVICYISQTCFYYPQVNI